MKTPIVSAVVLGGICSLLCVDTAFAYESQCRPDSAVYGGRTGDASMEASLCAPGDGSKTPPECDPGLEFARGAQMGEHTWIARAGMAAAGLTSFRDDVSLFHYYVDEHTVPGVTMQSVAPAGPAAMRTRALRAFSIPEFAQVPDGSFGVADFLLGNEHCLATNAQSIQTLSTLSVPSDPTFPAAYADAVRSCHVFRGHMGQVNSNHFLPQARSNYVLYHAIALTIAKRCKAMDAAFPAGASPPYPLQAAGHAAAVACEREAMAFQAAAAHFAGDAWSVGHMWERWGRPEFAALALDRLRAQVVSMFSGVVHGWRSVAKPVPKLNAFQDDQMCMPGPFDAALTTSPVSAWTYPGQPSAILGPLDTTLAKLAKAPPFAGGGDLYLRPCTARGDLLSSTAPFAQWAVSDGAVMAVQSARMITCVAEGFEEVYKAGPQSIGALTRTRAYDSGVGSSEGSECWDQRATNQTMAMGLGINRWTGFGEPSVAATAVLFWLPVVGGQVGGIYGDTAMLANVQNDLQIDLVPLAFEMQRAAILSPNTSESAQLKVKTLSTLLGIPANSAGQGLIDNDQVSYLERRDLSTWSGVVDSSKPCSSDEACPAHYFCDTPGRSAQRYCAPIESAVVRTFRVAETPRWCADATLDDMNWMAKRCQNGDGPDSCEACVQAVLPHLRNACSLAKFTPTTANSDNRAICDVVASAGLTTSSLDATAVYAPYNAQTSGDAESKALAVCQAGRVDALQVQSPTVTSVSVTSARVGDPVTITGTGLGGFGTSVHFNGVLAIGSKSDTQIVVNVPADAITGALTVTTPDPCGGTVTVAPTFTVAGPPSLTTYWLTETDSNIVTSGCLPCVGGSVNPFTTNQTFGSDGLFDGGPWTGTAGGAFNVNGLIYACSTDNIATATETFQGNIGPDGALGPTTLSVTVPAGSPYYGQGCWNQTASKTVAWAPQFVDWHATFGVTFPTPPCPLNNGSITEYVVAIRKDVKAGTIAITPYPGSSTWFTATLKSGGAYQAIGANSPLVAGNLFDATFTAGGSATGTVTFSYSDGCKETNNPITITPLSPVVLGIP